MSEILPTFRDNRDRVVFLLAEYKIPITLLLLAAGVWAYFASPSIPDIPPVYGWFALGFALICVPAWFVMLRIMRWVYSKDYYKIAVLDAGENEVYDAKRCPKSLWHQKTVTGPSPLDPDGEGVFDYVVTKWNHYEDIGELEVRGCEREDMTPAEATETRNRVDEYYNHHHELRRRYSKLKGQLQRKFSEAHDLVVMKMMSQAEEAELAIDKSLTDMIGEIEKEIDKLPDGPGKDSRNHVQKHHPGADDDLELDEALPIVDGRGSDGQPGHDMTGGSDPLAADGGSNE